MLRGLVSHRVPRLLGSLLLLLAAAIVFAAPAAAASPKRVWHASLSSNHGSATLTMMPTYAGSVTVDVQGLKPNTTYAAMIYKGTCAKPTTLVKLSSVRTDAS